MKKTITLAVIAAASGLASAQDVELGSAVIDISGYQTWGFQGDAQNEILSVFLGAWTSLTSISWDVNLSTIGISWAEEATIGILGSDGGIMLELIPGFGDGFTVTNMNYQGGGDTNIMLMDTGGWLNLEFYETGWDDNAGSPDALFEAGSTITFHGWFELPTPGIPAVFGVAGLYTTRRRR